VAEFGGQGDFQFTPARVGNGAGKGFIVMLGRPEDSFTMPAGLPQGKRSINPIFL
jgi:hypothetical protein